MKIKSFELGYMKNNCYIVWDENTNEAAIIDPSNIKPLAFIKENGLKLKYIILTHCHFDHIGGVRETANETGAKVAIHEQDAEGLVNNDLNLGTDFNRDFTQGNADILLKDGDALEVGTLKLTILHTPGHTKGGICILADEVLFSGDTLFWGSMGRSDFPGGNGAELIRSIKTKLMALDDKTRVYPGHGESTTIGEERRNNPYLL